MVAGRLERECSRRRDHIETAQAVLLRLMIDVDEVIVRNQQAISGKGSVDNILAPAIERLVEMSDDLHLARDELIQVWTDGQAVRWREISSQ